MSASIHSYVGDLPRCSSSLFSSEQQPLTFAPFRFVGAAGFGCYESPPFPCLPWGQSRPPLSPNFPEALEGGGREGGEGTKTGQVGTIENGKEHTSDAARNLMSLHSGARECDLFFVHSASPVDLWVFTFTWTPKREREEGSSCSGVGPASSSSSLSLSGPKIPQTPRASPSPPPPSPGPRKNLFSHSLAPALHPRTIREGGDFFVVSRVTPDTPPHSRGGFTNFLLRRGDRFFSYLSSPW